MLHRSPSSAVSTFNFDINCSIPIQKSFSLTFLHFLTMVHHSLCSTISSFIPQKFVVLSSSQDLKNLSLAGYSHTGLHLCTPSFSWVSLCRLPLDQFPVFQLRLLHSIFSNWFCPTPSWFIHLPLASSHTHVQSFSPCISTSPEWLSFLPWIWRQYISPTVNFYRTIWCHTFEVLTLVSSHTLMWEPQTMLNTWVYLPHYFQVQNVALVAEEALYSWRGKE